MLSRPPPSRRYAGNIPCRNAVPGSKLGNVSTPRARRHAVVAHGISSSMITLADGARLELLTAMPKDIAPGRAPMLFVHGAAHGAWCWAERFLPAFAQAGFEAHAVSLRAHGKSDGVTGSSAGTLLSNAQDLATVVAAMPGPPLVVGHSFGGLLCQRYIVAAATDPDSFPPLAAVALLGSPPPSGNGQLVLRLLKKAPVLGFQITWSFITQDYFQNAEALRRLFFSEDLPNDDLLRFQQLFAENRPSARLVDLRALSAEVPLSPLPAGSCPPALVLCGSKDLLVDEDACVELAQYVHTYPVIVEGMGHDCMLDSQWEVVVEELLAFARDPDSYRTQWADEPAVAEV